MKFLNAFLFLFLQSNRCIWPLPVPVPALAGDCSWVPKGKHPLGVGGCDPLVLSAVRSNVCKTLLRSLSLSSPILTNIEQYPPCTLTLCLLFISLYDDAHSTVPWRSFCTFFRRQREKTTAETRPQPIELVPVTNFRRFDLSHLRKSLVIRIRALSLFCTYTQSLTRSVKCKRLKSRTKKI